MGWRSRAEEAGWKPAPTQEQDGDWAAWGAGGRYSWGMTVPGFWLVVGSLVLVEAAIIVSALRMRLRPLAARSVVGGRPAEIVWTLLPALLLAALALLSLDAS